MRLLNNDLDNKKTTDNINQDLIDTFIKDADINKLAGYFSLNNKAITNANEILSFITGDEDLIKYRQEFSRDLFENEDIYNDLAKIYIMLTSLKDVTEERTSPNNKDLENYLVTLKWLSLYCTIINELWDFFKKHTSKIRSRAMTDFNNQVASIYESREFHAVNTNIRKLDKKDNELSSIRVGINVNEYLEAVSATCLEVGNFRYYPRKTIELMDGNHGKHHGIGRFKYKPLAIRNKVGDGFDRTGARVETINVNRMQRLIACEINDEFIQGVDYILKMLNFNNRSSVRDFIADSAGELIKMEKEIGFFLGGIGFCESLKNAGMPVCLPEIAKMDKKILKIKSIYNCFLPKILLNPSDIIVLNDFDMDASSTFNVLTGPNKGGKTTFVQGIMLSIILFQLGLYIPGEEAIISPFDMIFTHYQSEEKYSLSGSFASEVSKMKSMFENATENSLIFLNEPFVTTSPEEGKVLLINLLKAFKKVKCRGVLVTHFHKLNNDIKRGSGIEFYHMGILESENGKRTFEIHKGPGEVQSFAMDILREYAPELLE